MHEHPPQRFWADPELPFIELRATVDGRSLCYGRHSHAEFSVGLIESGRSLFSLHGQADQIVGAGDLLLINPGLPHQCRALPGHDDAWAYTMLYLDPSWLAGLQGGGAFQPLAASLLREPALAQGFRRLVARLGDALPAARKQQACADFFTALCRAAGRQGQALPTDCARLQPALDLLHERAEQPLRLAELAAAAGLSITHLLRLFRAHYGLSPHAYQLDLRVQRSRALLRQGSLPLAEVALVSGFADQAHWQRHYRRLHATTPGAYRRQLLRPAGPAPTAAAAPPAAG